MNRAGTECENGDKSIERRPAGRPTGYWRTIQPGVWLAMPNMLLLLLFFAAPMLMILGYAFTPPLTFEILSEATTENFESIIAEGYYRSFLWAIGLSGLSTVILLLLCYPVAYGLAKVFGRWSSVITLVFVMPLFVSETVKLYGWSIFFLKEEYCRACSICWDCHWSNSCTPCRSLSWVSCTSIFPSCSFPWFSASAWYPMS